MLFLLVCHADFFGSINWKSTAFIVRCKAIFVQFTVAGFPYTSCTLVILAQYSRVVYVFTSKHEFHLVESHCCKFNDSFRVTPTSLADVKASHKTTIHPLKEHYSSHISIHYSRLSPATGRFRWSSLLMASKCKEKSIIKSLFYVNISFHASVSDFSIIH